MAKTPRMPIIKGTIQQRQPNGTLIGLEFEGKVQKMDGPIARVAEVVLEAERHGNIGAARIHLFLQ